MYWYSVCTNTNNSIRFVADLYIVLKMIYMRRENIKKLKLRNPLSKKQISLYKTFANIIPVVVLA